ncbi:MAG: sigma-70 family RNA polymerase sigma factor [Opitutus sp.]|nr:sigma-70 family RNA polymerase sigma factor [Opitutus sp.]
MPPTETETNRCAELSLSQWFSEQVQPHEPALRAYLSKRFPALPDHDDLVQETYIRTLRAHEGGRVPCARAFLFTTARNAAIDLFRRRLGHTHEEISEFTALPLLDEAPDIAEGAERAQRLEVLLEAILALPERCRQVMMLRHLDGLAYKEIAGRLGISPETVKVHMIKGVKDCTRYFRQRGLLGNTEQAVRFAS